ncbi:MAG: acetyl/propionyl/methylcrotonyl-CoA carboxylase subunit alpha [Clostridia bacterium]|nr:acetyl/propionyl/methylcrotonyl-CoA carboxylase subunit alpha [Clostridia bacterium]
MPFKKILVANRGEIACRVFKTAKRMGIKTVAVYSDADRNAKHVKMADEAVYIGPSPSAQSYLVAEKIVEACRKTGADAVHPGYGFLSENWRFAETLEKEGICWCGPGKYAIEAMGDKIGSKKLAVEAKVNTIPGFNGEINSDEEVLKISNDIGYPVMIKASAGGGGKGMRIAWNDKEALAGFHLSKQEAKAAFGDDRMFIEKYIEEPRHIEIQVLADKHGNYCAFPERECSIQRRNQKVVEESPSVLLDEETRTAMGKQACMMAKAVNYCSAGTVEFLCDKHKNFYFLEMNTRLQVEHPITEMVTREDIVEHMFWIAAGKKLPDRLINWPLKRYAHAIETRVYAEDPRRNFLPSLGLLTKYIEPTGEGVRCDSGILDGSQISMYYDPMICKLVTWGDDRATAIKRMDDALNSYIIRGLNHNSAFLQDVIRSKRFASGKITTNFIKEEYPDGWTGSDLTSEEAQQLVAATMAVHQERLATEATNDQMLATYEPRFERELVATIGDKKYPVQVDFEGETMVLTVDGQKVTVENPAFECEKTIMAARVNGKDVKVQYFEPTTEGYSMQYCGGNFEVVLRSAREEELSKFMIPKVQPDTSKFLASPMAGSLVKVNVKEGDRVEAGQALAVVEAMKMQNELYAQKACVVKKVYFKPGQNLALDDVIMDFDTSA